MDLYGFYIYRAEESSGEFQRLNDTPVLSRGGADSGARYSFEDRSIEPGRLYRYYIVKLTNSGVEERLTRTLRSKPKFPTG